MPKGNRAPPCYAANGPTRDIPRRSTTGGRYGVFPDDDRMFVPRQCRPNWTFRPDSATVLRTSLVVRFVPNFRTQRLCLLGKSLTRLSEFLPIFESDRVDLLSRQFLSRFAGSAAGFENEALEARRHHDPQQNQFLIWTTETMPRVLWYENRSTSFARVTDIVECDHATAFENVEGFVLVEVSVNRNARALG